MHSRKLNFITDSFPLPFDHPFEPTLQSLKLPYLLNDDQVYVYLTGTNLDASNVKSEI